MSHASARIIALMVLAQPALLWTAGCRRTEQAPDLQKQIGRLHSDSAEEIYTALRNLQALTLKASPAVPDLRTLLASAKDSDMQAEIAKTLGLIGPDAAEAVPDLIALLDRKEMWPRYCAVEALGRMGHAGAAVLPKITPLTRDKDPDVSAAAVDAVRRLQRSMQKR